MKKILVLCFALIFAPAALADEPTMIIIDGPIIAGKLLFDINESLQDQCFNLGVSAIKLSREIIENKMTKEQAFDKLKNIPHYARDTYNKVVMYNMIQLVEGVYKFNPATQNEVMGMADSVYWECIDQLALYGSV